MASTRRAVGQLHHVDGDVAQVEEVEDLAGEAVLVRSGLQLLADGDLLRPQRQRALGAGRHAVDLQRVDFAQPGDAQAQARRIRAQHLGVEDVAGADEVRHEAVLRKAVDLGRLVELLDLALVHHRDPVRQRQRFLLVVGDVDERDADFLLQGDQLELHPLLELGVQRRQGLVEQQQPRARDQRPRHRDTLALAARQLVRDSARPCPVSDTSSSASSTARADLRRPAPWPS